MPQTFPTYDPATDELVPREYWSITEVADMFHVNHSTVRRWLRDGSMPSLMIASTYYMSAAMIGEWMDSRTTDTRPPDETPPPRLGTPVSDAELEPVL